MCDNRIALYEMGGIGKPKSLCNTSILIKSATIGYFELERLILLSEMENSGVWDVISSLITRRVCVRFVYTCGNTAIDNLFSYSVQQIPNSLLGEFSADVIEVPPLNATESVTLVSALSNIPHPLGSPEMYSLLNALDHTDFIKRKWVSFRIPC